MDNSDNRNYSFLFSVLTIERIRSVYSGYSLCCNNINKKSINVFFIATL